MSSSFKVITCTKGHFLYLVLISGCVKEPTATDRAENTYTAYTVAIHNNSDTRFHQVYILVSIVESKCSEKR